MTNHCPISFRSQLQRAAVAFGEQLPVPEVVAIGGQSDGKSSLLEAFLGFRFNVRPQTLFLVDRRILASICCKRQAVSFACTPGSASSS